VLTLLAPTSWAVTVAGFPEDRLPRGADQSDAAVAQLITLVVFLGLGFSDPQVSSACEVRLIAVTQAAGQIMSDILFIKTSSLGDVIHQMPALTEARLRLPQTRFPGSLRVCAAGPAASRGG
jgi:hypothetical protein